MQRSCPNFDARTKCRRSAYASMKTLCESEANRALAREQKVFHDSVYGVRKTGAEEIKLRKVG